MKLTDIIVKNKEHVTYKHTSLNWVIVQINYVNNSSDDFFDAYRAFIHEMTGLDLDRVRYSSLKNESVRLKSSDDSVSLKVSDSFVQYRISGKMYVDYHTSLRPFFAKVAKLFEETDATVEKVGIRKVNIWGYESDKASKPVEDFVNQVFSKKIMAFWHPEMTSEDGEVLCLTSLCDEISIDGIKGAVCAKFGYLVSDKQDMISRLILDSECELHPDIKGAAGMSHAQGINSKLYDLYHAAVNQNLIDAMNKA